MLKLTDLMVHIAFNTAGIYILDSQGTLIMLPKPSNLTEYGDVAYRLAMSPDFTVIKFEDIPKAIEEIGTNTMKEVKS